MDFSFWSETGFQDDDDDEDEDEDDDDLGLDEDVDWDEDEGLTLKGGYRKIFLFFHRSRWT